MDIEIKIKKKSVVLPCEMSQDAELGIHISSLFWQKSEDFVTSEKKNTVYPRVTLNTGNNETTEFSNMRSELLISTDTVRPAYAVYILKLLISYYSNSYEFDHKRCMSSCMEEHMYTC